MHGLPWRIVDEEEVQRALALDRPVQQAADNCMMPAGTKRLTEILGRRSTRSGGRLLRKSRR